MSQITRCPSCATSFKVVADQLRISQGWVRCGQCKEVFDASAHLLPAAPPALLPDVSLADIRPPLAPVARKAEAGRAWGEPPPSQPPTSPPLGGWPGVADAAAFSFSPVSVPSEAAGGYSEVHTPVGSPVLEVPQPAVPAFLSAAGGVVASGENSGVGHLVPFAWRPDTAFNVPATGRGGTALQGDSPPPVVFAGTAVGGHGPSSEAVQMRVASPPSPAAVRGVGHGEPGYELPFAALRDAEDGAPDSVAPVALTPMGYPALELPIKPPVVPLQDTEPDHGAPATPSAAKGVTEPLPPVDFSPSPEITESEPEALALVEDHSPATVLQAPSRKPSSAREGADPADEDEGLDAGQEVSFVVAARRKAFWRKPMVRVVLAVLLLLSVVGLGLQVAVQERDRLAAMDVRTRPWLMALCASLRCEIAPQREIADVVIDSSSFNKARGDSYQLALTMKSKSSTPLAMPAVELTLTDAQDQPVLRRVLLPTDMGAPMELPARGEWSASVSVLVTTGGARVAGYRLLAFYP